MLPLTFALSACQSEELRFTFPSCEVAWDCVFPHGLSKAATRGLLCSLSNGSWSQVQIHQPQAGHGQAN